MSRASLRRALVLALGALLCLTEASRAQTAAAAARRFAALRDTLARVQARLASRTGALDTLPLGPVRLVLRPDLAERIRPAMPGARETLERRFGAVKVPPVGALRIDLVVGGGGTAPHLEARFYPTETGWGSGVYYAGTAAPTDSIAVMLAAAAGDGLWPAAGPAVREWVQGVPLAWWGDGGNLEPVYVEMVTDPLHSTQACFRGDRQACRRALGLLPSADPARDWYDPEDRRTRILQQSGRWLLAERRPQVVACLDRREYGMCDVLFSLLNREGVPPPLSPVARRSLAWLVLRQGGAGAFQRLVGDPAGSLGDRLAVTAGLPLDSLLGLWHAEVVRARPRIVAVTPGSGWMALGWVVLLGMLALRSSRWR